MKLEFCRNISEKYSNNKFCEKSVEWKLTDGDTDRYDVANSHFSQFLELA